MQDYIIGEPNLVPHVAVGDAVTPNSVACMTVGVAGPCVGGQGKGKSRERMREDKGAYGGYRGCMAKSVVRRLKSGGWVWEAGGTGRHKYFTLYSVESATGTMWRRSHLVHVEGASRY